MLKVHNLYMLKVDNIVKAWPEMTGIINILIYCKFAYHVESASTKLYYAMLLIANCVSKVVHVQPTSRARVFSYAWCCGKDPDSGWSHDTPKSGVYRIATSCQFGRSGRGA